MILHLPSLGIKGGSKSFICNQMCGYPSFFNMGIYFGFAMVLLSFYLERIQDIKIFITFCHSVSIESGSISENVLIN
jgi:hypothetical protein